MTPIQQTRRQPPMQQAAMQQPPVQGEAAPDEAMMAAAQQMPGADGQEPQMMDAGTMAGAEVDADDDDPDVTDAQILAFTVLGKLTNSKVLEAIVRDAQTGKNAPDACARNAAIAVWQFLQGTEEEFSEMSVVPAAVIVALFLLDMLEEAGAAQTDERSVVETQQLAMQYILQEAGESIDEQTVQEVGNMLPPEQMQGLMTEMAVLMGNGGQ